MTNAAGKLEDYKARNWHKSYTHTKFCLFHHVSHTYWISECIKHLPVITRGGLVALQTADGAEKGATVAAAVGGRGVGGAQQRG
jgi:hypothetical protein